MFDSQENEQKNIKNYQKFNQPRQRYELENIDKNIEQKLYENLK